MNILAVHFVCKRVRGVASAAIRSLFLRPRRPIETVRGTKETGVPWVGGGGGKEMRSAPQAVSTTLGRSRATKPGLSQPTQL